MIKLNVPDMSCGHCAGVITKTLKELDCNATIEFDMPKRIVSVTTSEASADIIAALNEAGYPATPA